MTPFLGIDITELKRNEEFEVGDFLVEKPSDVLAETHEKSYDTAMAVLEKAKFPLPVRIVHWLCGAFGLLSFVGMMNSLTDENSVPFSEAYANAWWLFWLTGICLVVWLVLTLLSRKKEKKVIESDAMDIVTAKLQSSAQSFFAQLGVPSSAEEVDVLSFTYKMKNGMPKACTRGMQTIPYINFVYKIYSDREYMYLVDLEGKYRFSLSSLRAIHTVKKKIAVPNWNKETPPNKGEYKQYKLYVDDEIHIKKYHILELQENGETWGIYFPNYELPTFEKITGLKAE